MLEVKKVGYDEWEHSGNDNPLCPYCNKYNETTDLDKSDGETTEIECDHCGKVFVYTPSISVSYDTMPYENWYMDARERMVKRKERYEKIENKTDWHKVALKRVIQSIEELDKEAERILGEHLRSM